QHQCMPKTIGKRQWERVEKQWPRVDTSRRCNTTNLQPATRGSLGLDLAAAIDVTLMTSRPHKIPTNVKGPVIIGEKLLGALLLGRSSASMLGLFVLPGIIDADYTGEIMIMAYTPFPPIMISKGQKIAQLIPLEQITKDMSPLLKEQREDKGFGSSGNLTLLTINLNDRPKRKVEVEYQGQKRSFVGLLDTGADSSIISPDCWPKHWPLQPSTITVTGVGGLTLASCTPPLKVKIDEKIITATFSVVTLPPTVSCLIGRDILAQIGVIL
ncbi:POK9 protein, partial [Psilopogon haemacephalus]|nr:POK9 protein [Psilopogon haemacephalus]